MRALLAFAVIMSVLGIGATRASAETELLVMPPLGKDTDAVKAALAKASVGKLATRSIDAACATDPGCLTKVGNENSARRVLAIQVSGTRLTLTVVDAGARALLATRDIDVPKKKLAKELGPTLKKFVDEAIVDKAKALFAEGNEHYNLGEFQQALDKYKLAYRVKPLPAFQFNIAQCHRKLGQHQDAIAMYQAYLVGVPNAENKSTIESLIAESKKAIADKQAVESQREKDRLATEQKKAEEARKAKEAQAAADAEQAKAEQARIAAEREREAQYNRHPARRWMLLTGALGLAAAGGGVYFWTRAQATQERYDNAGCPNYPDMALPANVLDQCIADDKLGKRDALIGNIGVASGGAIVAASLLVFILDPGNVERPNAARASVSVSPTSFQVVVQW